VKKRFKKMLFFSITFLFLFSFSLNVNASVIENDFTRNIVVAVGEKCPALGDPTNSQYPAYWLQEALNIMRYIAIVALLVLVTIDFVKAVASNDKDALKKAGSTAIKRFIYCVLLFFVPIVIKIVMTMFGAYGSCGIG
jgi:hypothetical protein